MLMAQRMRAVMTISIAAGLVGTVGGTLIHEWLRFIPAGPAITLVLFVEFVAAYTISRLLLRTA